MTLSNGKQVEFRRHIKRIADAKRKLERLYELKKEGVRHGPVP